MPNRNCSTAAEPSSGGGFADTARAPVTCGLGCVRSNSTSCGAGATHRFGYRKALPVAWLTARCCPLLGGTKAHVRWPRKFSAYLARRACGHFSTVLSQTFDHISRRRHFDARCTCSASELNRTFIVAEKERGMPVLPAPFARCAGL